MATKGLLKRTERYKELQANLPSAYRHTLRMHEYMLVLQPHEELRNHIMQMKDAFAEKYDAPMARFLEPHITLVRFLCWDMMETKIVHRLQHIAMSTAAFSIELKDYGSFPSHTIYIQVASKVAIVNLVKELKNVQGLMKADPTHEPHFISDPHIAIARKLQPWQYEKGWLEYAHEHFSGMFIANDMWLLKRPAGGRAYSVVERFGFQNMPVAMKQGALFT